MSDWKEVSTNFSTVLIKVSVTAIFYIIPNIILFYTVQTIEGDNLLYFVFATASAAWFMFSSIIGGMKIVMDSKQSISSYKSNEKNEFYLRSDRMMIFQACSAAMAFLLVLGLPCVGERWMNILTFGKLPASDLDYAAVRSSPEYERPINTEEKASSRDSSPELREISKSFKNHNRNFAKLLEKIKFDSPSIGSTTPYREVEIQP